MIYAGGSAFCALFGVLHILEYEAVKGFWLIFAVFPACLVYGLVQWKAQRERHALASEGGEDRLKFPIGRMERHKDTCNVHMASAMRDVASVPGRLETTQEYRVPRSDKIFTKRCTRTRSYKRV